MKQNMHTHTTWCDGKDTPKEMVETAIDKGFDVLGFSGHGHCFCDDVSMSETGQKAYMAEVRKLQRAYAGRIRIYLGIEEDLFQPVEDPEDFDYIIGSVHFIRHEDKIGSVDESRSRTDAMVKDWFGGDFLAYAKAYYENVQELRRHPEADIIGHVDLLTKYNEDESYITFDDPRYLKLACDTIDALSGRLFEVNTGAIARGYRKRPYPDIHLMRYMHEHGIPLILNSDCHDRRQLDCAFDAALDLIVQAGYRELMTFDGSRFTPLPIEMFQSSK
ncbi:histidinol-phosphatase [Catenisphaera adipataccumulans]|uniref:Histidinol-phosphatase n=1 Tax=Catenisphaera adipataccumulans TaxID=700500 RepID=A0A7W8FW88_9FIRM|nr:histidinol-phosphatase [Catenisphaera adipataccumulans]MBB5182981.1 histidinol-phosphatase (PHP family) [Catenisphaera adipataccumulans]